MTLSPQFYSSRIDPETREVVAAATARFVNAAVERRIERVAGRERDRELTEMRVWRGAIAAIFILLAVLAAFIWISHRP